MAECLLNRLGSGRFQAHSAGSHPKGAVHPTTLALLGSMGYDTTTLSSKSWDVFARAEAEPLDFVFTVCDAAAGEACPVWPGQPVTAHWGVPDPAAFVGSKEEELRYFRQVYLTLGRRIQLFVEIPIEKLDRLSLTHAVEVIGKEPPSAETNR
jgi:protein-tyrosine-phosphatase